MKKIIALAVAAAFVAPVAMAEVTVYGSLRTAVEYSKISNTANDYSKFRLADQSSRLGFKGTDKLDSGLTVLWQAEQRVRVGATKADGTNDSADAGKGWGDRDTFVGLQGDFGLVRAGKFDDIFDAAGGDFMGGMVSLDETSSVYGNYVRRARSKSVNTIAYHSPSFGGFGFKAQYVLGEKDANANINGYAATAFYKAKMFEIGAGYKGMKDTNSYAATVDGVDANKASSYLVGASVMPIDGLKISAGYDVTKKTTGANEYKQAGYAMGAAYTTGKYVFQGSIGALADAKLNGTKVASSGGWGAGLGMAYNLSKQTQLLAGASYIKNDDNASADTGWQKGGNGSFDAAAGAKVTTVSVGIKTTF